MTLDEMPEKCKEFAEEMYKTSSSHDLCLFMIMLMNQHIQKLAGEDPTPDCWPSPFVKIDCQCSKFPPLREIKKEKEFRS